MRYFFEDGIGENGSAGVRFNSCNGSILSQTATQLQQDFSCIWLPLSIPPSLSFLFIFHFLYLCFSHSSFFIILSSKHKDY